MSCDYVYLDNAATTVVSSSVLDKVVNVMLRTYANPSSSHKMGVDSRRIIEASREFILNYINSCDGKVVFTSSGTEANNLAIMGVVNQNKEVVIITTSIEHPSVLNVINCLKNYKVNVKFLKLNSKWEVDIKDFSSILNEKTILVSVAMVNNEVGLIQPIEIIGNIIRKSRFSDKIIFHVDAVQAFGKIDIDVQKLGIDLLSASAHKIHGPKGVGFLYISKNVFLKPIIYGGGQEFKIRSGTEAVELIAGFKEAVKECDLNKDFNFVKDLNFYIREKLYDLKNIIINSPFINTSPYIINFSILGIKSEIMLNFLSSKKIYVSAASACAKGKRSYVLKNLGLDNDLIDSAIRISFSKFNTKNEIDVLISEIRNAKKQLINFNGG